jgi:hypothetical protein
MEEELFIFAKVETTNEKVIIDAGLSLSKLY